MNLDTVDEISRKRREILKRELSKMRERDENALLRHRAEKKEKIKEAIERMYHEKSEKGVTIILESVESKQFVKKVFSEEEHFCLQDKKVTLDAESSRMKSHFDHKHSFRALPRGVNLIALAADFFNSKHMASEHLPGSIRRELTCGEINDLRMVFDIFDVKNRGYVTAEDIRRAVGILGYSSKKKVFKGMINDVPKDKQGHVTFKSFLELVIKLQGDGPDIFEEIVKFFHLLDRGDKGYITFTDLVNAADEVNVHLSNKAVPEMIEEADRNGDGKVSFQELTQVLQQMGKLI